MPTLRQTAGVQNGEDPIFANSLMQRGDQVLLWNRALGEKLFHQFVFPFRDQLHQCFMRGLRVSTQVAGNLADLAPAIATRRVVKRLHGHQVDDALKSLRIHDGQLHRDQVAAVAIFHVFENAFALDATVSAWMIQLIDHHHPGQVELLCALPHAIGDRFRPYRCIHNHQRGLNRQHRAFGFMREHVKARSVDEIHFNAVPFSEGDRGLHGGAARNFFFVVGGHSGAVFHPPKFVSHFGGMQQSGDERRLPTVRMPYYSYVADLTSQIRFHANVPSIPLAQPSCVLAEAGVLEQRKPALDRQGRSSEFLLGEERPGKGREVTAASLAASD